MAYGDGYFPDFIEGGGGSPGSGGGLTLPEVNAAIRGLVPGWARQAALREQDIPQSIFRDVELTGQAVRSVLNLSQADLNDFFKNAVIQNANLVLTRLDDTQITLPLSTGTPNAAVGTLSDPQLTGTVLSFAVAGNSDRTTIDLASLAGHASDIKGALFVPDTNVLYPTADSHNDIKLMVTGASATYTEGDSYRFFVEGANTGTMRLQVESGAYAPVLREDLTPFVGNELKLDLLMQVVYNSNISSWVSDIDPVETLGPVTPMPEPEEYTIRYGLMNAAKNNLSDIRTATLYSPPNHVNLIFPSPTSQAPNWFIEIPSGLTFSKMINTALHDVDDTSDWEAGSANNATENSSVRIYDDGIVGVIGRYRLEVTVDGG